MADFLQTLSIAVVLGSLYALIALGYTMVFGVLKLINFAHSDVVALGAWTSLSLAVMLLPWLGVNPQTASPWWAAAVVLMLTMAFCGAIGLAIERFAYKPIRKAPRLNALITAIGVSLLLQNLGQLRYTLWANSSEVAAGSVIERKPGVRQATPVIQLSEPITIEPGYLYELRIGKNGDPTTRPATPEEIERRKALIQAELDAEAKGQPAPAATQPEDTSSKYPRTSRKIVAPPGKYSARSDIAIDTTIGRTQTVDAWYRLVRTSDKPSITFPFGAMPASVPPGLVPRDSGETVAAEKREIVEANFFQLAPGPAVLAQFNFFEAGPPRPDGSPSRIYKPLKITTIDAVIVIASIALMIALQFVVFHTRTGTAMRAVSYNMDTAALMGIPVNRVVSFTFVTGTMLAAAAGFLYALRYNPINQTADAAWVLLGLKAFVAAVVGGIGNIRGATVGGFLIAFVEQFSAYCAQQIGWDQGSALTDVFVFLLLIVVLLVKPTGIFGSTVREKV